MAAKQAVVTFAKGDPKKHSVKMEAISATLVGAEAGTVLVADKLGDIYVSRHIMDALGLKDSATIQVTFQGVNKATAGDSELI
jgi:hypothetical protein